MKQLGKKLYQPMEAYMILYRAFRSVKKLKKAMHTGIITEQWKERIMLAVTQVMVVPCVLMPIHKWH